MLRQCRAGQNGVHSQTQPMRRTRSPPNRHPPLKSVTCQTITMDLNILAHIEVDRIITMIMSRRLSIRIIRIWQTSSTAKPR